MHLPFYGLCNVVQDCARFEAAHLCARLCMFPRAQGLCMIVHVFMLHKIVQVAAIPPWERVRGGGCRSTSATRSNLRG